MPRTLRFDVAQFSRYPNLPKLLLKQCPDVRSELGDRQDAPSGRLREQVLEIPLRFSFLAHRSVLEQERTVRECAGQQSPCRSPNRFLSAPPAGGFVPSPR